MNTRVLMSVTAVFLASMGIAASFLPQEILAYTDSAADGLAVVIVQVAGALNLGFAVLDWTARSNLIGGIYSRPVALGNFLHFVMVALALWKSVSGEQPVAVLLAAAVIYSAFAVCFGLVLFTHPRTVTGSGRM